MAARWKAEAPQPALTHEARAIETVGGEAVTPALVVHLQNGEIAISAHTGAGHQAQGIRHRRQGLARIQGRVRHLCVCFDLDLQPQ